MPTYLHVNVGRIYNSFFAPPNRNQEALQMLPHSHRQRQQHLDPSNPRRRYSAYAVQLCTSKCRSVDEFSYLPIKCSE